MKVYISGPISSDDFYKIHFARAEEELKEAGYEVVSPVVDEDDGVLVTYKEFIDHDLQLLADCDAIYMLRNWQKSKGARLEHQYARTTEMWIAYQ